MSRLEVKKRIRPESIGRHPSEQMLQKSPCPGVETLTRVRSNSLPVAKTALFLLSIFLIQAATLCTVAYAQTMGTGEIQGVVQEGTGAVVPRATVTAVNTATGYTMVQRTSATGVYVLPALPPGDYRITVEAAGFEKLIREQVAVNALSTLGLNLSLKVGAVSETVVVNTLPPQINTSNGALENTIATDTYAALPVTLNAAPKSPLALVYTLPGAIVNPEGGTNDSGANLNGGPGNSSYLYVNGMPLSQPELQGDPRNVEFSLPVEAVDQVQVVSSGLPAYYTGQGAVNFVMKTGTNAFHGNIYENIRNTVFDAAGYFATTTPIEKQNEFGVTFSGPLLKNRLFFVFNYGGYRESSNGNPAYLSIPTPAEQTGDFSALPVAIYDPTTKTCNAANVCTEQQFSYNGKLNVIPPSRISSISQSLQSYLPAPTNSALQSNYLGIGFAPISDNSYYGKVDYSITKNNRVSFLTQYGSYIRTGLTAAATAALPLPYGAGRYTQFIVGADQIQDTQVITSNLINVFGFQYNFFFPNQLNPSTQGNYLTKAGLTGIPSGQASENFPTITFTAPNGPSNWAGSSASIIKHSATSTFQDNIQWVHGSHSVTIGGQLTYAVSNTTTPNQISSFAFSNDETAGFNTKGALVTTTGNSYASFLLGLVNKAGLTDTPYPEEGDRYRNYAMYAQDDWKLTPKLTVNLGLRYEIPIPLFEVKNRLSWFNPSLPNPEVDNYPGALQFAGNGPDSCNCRTNVQTHYLTFDPRVGFAYAPRPGTVVRGSFTIIHYNGGALGGNSGNASPGQLGYAANPTESTPNSGISPAFNWNNGFPAYTPAPSFVSTLNTGYNTTVPAGSTITYNEPESSGRAPYIENWNLTVEQQFGSSTSLSLSYAANASRLLALSGGFGIYSDTLDPKYLALGSLLQQTETPATLAQAQAIFPSIALPYANFAGSISQMLLPFPQYTGISDQVSDHGTGMYNSMQVLLKHTASHGLYAHLAYTWSKEIDDAGGPNALAGQTTGNRSAYNLLLQRAVFPVSPQVVTIVYAYALPFGRGHSFGGRNGLTNTLVGGWSLSGINNYSSGTLLGPFAASCLLPNAGTCYADYNPTFTGPTRINGAWGSGQPKISTIPYINVSAFQNPASFTYGTTPETGAYDLRAPGYLNENVSLTKVFNTWKEAKLKLRADAFNVFNRTQFGGIKTNITNVNFGTVTTQANNPRNLQFEAYISF